MIYTVQSVFRGKEYESKYGTMVVYKLGVASEDGDVEPVELSQKITTPPVVEGQKINGHIEEGQYGKKLKKDPMGPNADMRVLNQAPYKASQSPRSNDMSKEEWAAKDRAKEASIAFWAASHDAVAMTNNFIANTSETHLDDYMVAYRKIRSDILQDYEHYKGTLKVTQEFQDDQPPF